MYYSSIKNICQVSAKCLIIGAFLHFLVLSGLVYAATDAERDAAIDLFFNEAIAVAKEAALNGLKNGEFKYLYDPKDPRSEESTNQALKKRLEDAVVATINEGRERINQDIINACGALTRDITECPPFQNPAAFGSKLSDSVLQQFENASKKAPDELNQLIQVTEAHTTQVTALAEITAKLNELAVNKKGVLAQEEFIDSKIKDSRDAQGELSWWQKWGGGLEKIERGIKDLDAAKLQVNRISGGIDSAIERLNSIKVALKGGTLKPADIDQALVGARAIIRAIQSAGSMLDYILQWKDLVWLVEQANIRNPNDLTDLMELRKSIRDRLAPANAAEEAMKTKEGKDKIEKLKSSLGVPGINPNLNLPEQLRRVAPCDPKPKPVGDKPKINIIGVDGIPPTTGITPKPSKIIQVPVWDAAGNMQYRPTPIERLGKPTPREGDESVWEYRLIERKDKMGNIKIYAEPVRVDKSAMR